MAVDNPGVIDIVSIDPMDYVVLTVADHLDWSDTVAHQTMLQTKLNRYLTFIESGEIFEKYPKARGRKVRISIVTQYDPDAEGLRFLERAGIVIEGAGFSFGHRQSAERQREGS